MPLRIGRTALELPTPAEERTLADTFRVSHCVTLPGFLDPVIRRALFARALSGAWETLIHDALDPPAIDLRLLDDAVMGTIAALTNAPALFACIQRVTGCEPIGCYSARVYRMDPMAHTDTWHGDDDGNRLLTLSVNLGESPFEGGALELRDRATRRPIHRVQNTGPGDAILFRVREDLEHRVEAVQGTVPKYAIAGWFQRRPVLDLAGLVADARAC